MAHTNVTRVGSFHTKKLLSQMVISINEVSKRTIKLAGNYLVAILPENCVINDAYVVVKKAGAGTVDVGTTEGGAEVLSAVDITSVGVVGTIAGKTFTGTGKDVYVELSAAPGAGEFDIVIEYMELDVDTGSMTRIKN